MRAIRSSCDRRPLRCGLSADPILNIAQADANKLNASFVLGALLINLGSKPLAWLDCRHEVRTLYIKGMARHLVQVKDMAFHFLRSIKNLVANGLYVALATEFSQGFLGHAFADPKLARNVRGRPGKINER